MTRRHTPLWALGLTALLINLALAVQVGDPAPNFELVDTEGTTHTLNDYAGQVLFINFFGYNCSICISQGAATETQIHQEYAGPGFAAIGIDVWNGPTPSVEGIFRTQTGVTYPLLTLGQSTATAYGVDRQYVVIDGDGIVQYIGPPSQLNVTAIQAAIEASLDEPTFLLEMPELVVEYVNITQDSSHWPTPYVFHGRITSVAESNINLTFTLDPVDPDPTEERRRFSVCNADGCYPPVHGFQSWTRDYTPGEVDTLIEFSVYWEVTSDEGFPVIANLMGDYLFDVSIYNTENPDDGYSYRLELRDVTDEGVTIRPSLVESHRLLSNYPNPFNPSTNINFTVEQAGPVTVTVFDILGRNVAEIINTTLAAGSYSTLWDAKSTAGVTLPSGSYWVHLRAAGQSTMHRIVLLR